MNLQDILPATPRITATPVLLDLRAAAYLETYPHILGSIPKRTVPNQQTFLQLAAMVYGWMPRVLRIDHAHLAAAVTALQCGTAATATTFNTVAINDIAACLRSAVGASKMLHFVNDTVFPIWDSRIEAFRLQLLKHPGPTNAHMSNTANYLAYVSEVYAIQGDIGFPAFYKNFQVAYSGRQTAMGVVPYPISEVRAIEAAAFELS